MDPIAVAALIISIISILLWVYSFFFQNKTPIQDKPELQDRKQEDAGSVPDVRHSETPAPSISAEYIRHEAQFMGETQKFSHMVRKNLEMLNTRVGIKFDVKPISEKYSNKGKGPDYIDSMDVSEERNSSMITDDSGEES